MQHLIKKHRQIILYGALGATGASLDFLLYLTFHYSLGITPAAASFLSVSAGIINNFFLNVYLNFRTSDHLLKRLLNFYVVGLGGVIASTLLIYVLYDLLGMDAVLAKLVTIPPIVLAQYIINKRISFNERAEV